MAVLNSGMTLYQNMDTDTNWTGEDGISTEEFQQGTASQQWIVAKSGDETATLSLSANMTGAKYLIIPMISTISPFYTLISANITDGTNTELFTMADQLGGALHRAVAGQWQFNSHCLQFGNNGGSVVLANFSGVDVRCDNSNSGNIRSVLNTYIDAIYYGTGRTIGGTTVGDKLFGESNDLDISGDTFDGCTLEYEGEIFCQTDVTITTTSGNSYGETIVFRDVPNTDSAYTLTVTGTVHFKNTIKASGTARISIDFSGATSAPHEAAAVIRGGTITYKLGQTTNSVVYTDCLAFVVPNLPAGCTYADSGQMTLTGTLSGAIFTNPVITANTAAVVTDDLADIGDADFTRGTNGYAVELTSIGAGSMIWSGTLSGYRSGATGSPITATNLGDEAIFVNVASGTLDINVAAGATIPSVRSAGAIVNVIAGLVTLSISTQTGNEVRIKQGSYTIQHNQNVVGEVETYSYTYAADTRVTISVGNSGFIRRSELITLPSSDSLSSFTLEPDPSYIS